MTPDGTGGGLGAVERCNVDGGEVLENIRTVRHRPL